MGENDLPVQGKKIAIVTDAWAPLTNGVVTTLKNVTKELRASGYEVKVISPDMFRTRTTREISRGLLKRDVVSMVWGNPAKVYHILARELESFKPDKIFIPVPEGTLGMVATQYCNHHGFNYTTAFTTSWPDYIRKWFKRPRAQNLAEGTMDIIEKKWWHSGASTIMVPTRKILDELEGKNYDKLVRWTRGVAKEFQLSDAPDPRSIYDQFTTEEFLSTLPEDERRKFAQLKDKSRPIFLSVGRIATEKELDVFMNADLRGLKGKDGEKVDGIKVVIGPADLEEYKQKLQRIDPDAIFLGPIAHDKLPAFLHGADVSAFPSTTDTFGQVQTEALACGKPVAYRPNAASDSIMGEGSENEDMRGKICASNTDFRTACEQALQLTLKPGGCAQDCRTFIDSYYKSWEEAARILADNLIDVGAPHANRDYALHDPWSMEHLTKRARVLDYSMDQLAKLVPRHARVN